jgi:general secretion pathway protein D
MEDRTTFRDTTIPGVSSIPLVGEAFRSVDRDVRKVETVIFIRPIVVVNPSIETDLNIYKQYLEPEYIKQIKPSASGGAAL